MANTIQGGELERFKTATATPPPIEVSTEAPTEVPTEAVQPEIINKESLLGNIQKTAMGKADVLANEAFIQGVAKFKTGKAATAEDLAAGGTVGDVVNRFGIGEQIEGFGITEPKVEEVKVEPKKTLLEQIREIRAPSADIMGEASKVAGLQTANTRLAEAQKAQSKIQDNITRFIETSSEEIKETVKSLEGQGRGIVAGLIQAQQGKMFTELTEEKQKELKNLKQDLILSQQNTLIEQGAYDRASAFARETAETMKEDIDNSINDLLLQNQIDQQTANLYKQEAQTEFDRQAEGFALLTPEQAQSIPENQKITLPDGRTYLKPQEEEVADEFQFVAGTANQQGGIFNKTTGQFIPGAGGRISPGGATTSGGVQTNVASFDESGKPLGDNGKFTDDVEFAFNEKIDIEKIPDIGGKQITNKTARQGNLPFGVTDKQADWIIDHRAGNVQFQQLKSAEIEKLADLIELREDILELKDLKTKVNTGPLASKIKQASRFAGREDEDFNRLEIKSGKQLANFIKEISGAAVSEQEAQRLARLVPNVSMQDNQFKTAVEDLEDDLNKLIQTKVNQFDLDSEAQLTGAVLGGAPVLPNINKEGETADDILSQYGIK